MRKFSSYGPVSKTLHYYVPRKELVEQALLRLRGEVPEEGGHYITVWAPRQCGKTWIMRETLWELENDERFSVLKINLEELKGETEPDKAVVPIAEEMRKLADIRRTEIHTLKEFSSLFMRENLGKPLILILDEFDALDEAVISGLVSVFRNIFIRRTEDKANAFQKEYLLHGVALIGVRSVLGVENVKGSPFNVQQSMHIPNLTAEEVRSLFEWYEKESRQKVEPSVIGRIHSETRGQPGMVSWLGELLTEGYDGYEPYRTRPITEDDFEEVFADAVNVLPNNNILNIISKARQTPYKELVLELFRTGENIPFRFDDPLLNFLYMNGVVDREKISRTVTAVRFSCPFVQKRLFNYFSREIFRTMDHLYDPMTDIDAIAGEEDISIPRLMELYRSYLSQNRGWLLKDAPRRKTDLRIYEAVFHFSLYTWLQSFFQDKEGHVFPEFPTGNGKVDILIRYGKKRYALELKSFRDRQAYKKALSRAAEYAVQLGLGEIFLILFIEAIDDENRQQLEAVHHDEASGTVVLPIFVETGNAPG